MALLFYGFMKAFILVHANLHVNEAGKKQSGIKRKSPVLDVKSLQGRIFLLKMKGIEER